MKEFTSKEKKASCHYHSKQHGGGKSSSLGGFSKEIAKAVGLLMGTLFIPSMDSITVESIRTTNTKRWLMTSLLLCMETLHHNAK